MDLLKKMLKRYGVKGRACDIVLCQSGVVSHVECHGCVVAANHVPWGTRKKELTVQLSRLGIVKDVGPCKRREGGIDISCA